MARGYLYPYRHSKKRAAGPKQLFLSICEAHEPGIQLPDARFIPYTSERADGDSESGKFQYVVEMLAVIDYSIYQRSVMSTALGRAECMKCGLLRSMIP